MRFKSESNLKMSPKKRQKKLLVATVRQGKEVKTVRLEVRQRLLSRLLGGDIETTEDATVEGTQEDIKSGKMMIAVFLKKEEEIKLIEFPRGNQLKTKANLLQIFK